MIVVQKGNGNGFGVSKIIDTSPPKGRRGSMGDTHSGVLWVHIELAYNLCFINRSEKLLNAMVEEVNCTNEKLKKNNEEIISLK